MKMNNVETTGLDPAKLLNPEAADLMLRKDTCRYNVCRFLSNNDKEMKKKSNIS